MHTGPSLYRSTLIAAAVGIGCCGASAAAAHDHGWRGQERGWQHRGGPAGGAAAPLWRAARVDGALPGADRPPTPSPVR
jgi:hypothetical protein